MLLIQTISVYIGLLALMFYFSKKSISVQRKNLMWMPVVIYTLVFGMRYGVGIDYYSYAGYYNSALLGAKNLYLDSIEPSFKFIVDTCAFFDIGEIPYMCIIVFLQIVFLFAAFKEERYILPYLSVVIILTGVAQMQYMNIMRQTIAWGIFVYSIRYIEKGAFFKYCLFILLAISFHTSAIILLPAYLVRFVYKSLDKISIQLILLLFFIAFTVVNPLDELMRQFDNFVTVTRYSDYSTFDDSLINNEEARSLGLFDILQFVLYIIIILNSKKLKVFYGRERFGMMYFLFFVGVLASLLFRGSTLFTRVIQYFAGFDVIIYAYCLYYWKKQRKVVPAYKTIAILFYLIICLGFTRLLYYSEENTMQYSFYFQDDFNKIKDKQFLKEHRMPNN